MKRIFFTLIVFLFLSTSLYSQTELVSNGSFESSAGSKSASPWYFDGNNPGFYIGSWNPHSGNNYAYLGADINGNYINNVNGVLLQSITIPNNATTVTLKFWLKITSDEVTTNTIFDFLGVYFGQETLLGFSNLSTKNIYEQKSAIINVSQYQGQTVNLTFSGNSDNAKPTVFRIDDVSLTYTPTQQYGSVNVTISPNEVVSAGAQWNLDGGTWQYSGTTLNNISTGNHTVNFNTISGWTSPSSKQINVTDNNTSSTSGTYTQTQQYGSVNVTISPSEVVSAGAQWNLDGGTWQYSGTTLNNISTGNHTVNFNTISGWTSPDNLQIDVTVNNTKSVSATYILLSQTGNLSISTTPVNGEIFVDGVSKGFGNWSGQVPVGNYNVSFGEISGYSTPLAQTTYVIANQTKYVTGVYLQTSNFSVIIDSVMVTESSITQEGTGKIERKRKNLNQVQIEVRQRLEIHFVAKCLYGNVDVSNESQIEWYSNSQIIGTGGDIKYSELVPGTHQITVTASYQGKTANSAMSKPINIIEYPELCFPFTGNWKTNNGVGGNYYNFGSHKKIYALDFNSGTNSADDWGLPVLSPITGIVSKVGLISLEIQSLFPVGYTVKLIHMSAIFIKVGDPVSKGQIIGLCGGKSGYSPHIHFEMWKGDVKTIPSIPEPIYNGNNILVQQIENNVYYEGKKDFLKGAFNYVGEQMAIFSGPVQSSGIFGFGHGGILSLDPQTTATYPLGYFNSGDKLKEIGFFVPYSENEDNVYLQNVPNPPKSASAKLIFDNDIIWNINQINPFIRKGMFNVLVPPVPFSPDYTLIKNGNVFLELQGEGLIFDEIRFIKKPAGSGGIESPSIIITRAEYNNNRLLFDIYNPYSANQKLSEMEILHSNNGADTLALESRSLDLIVPSLSFLTFSVPWLSLSDTLQVMTKIYTQTGVYDVVHIDLGNVTDIASTSQVPLTFSLRQNYPNPFNSSTIIEYDLPKITYVKVVVFDMLGRNVKTLTDKEQSAGNYKVVFDASDITSGVYFYQIQTNEFRQTKKLILLR